MSWTFVTKCLLTEDYNIILVMRAVILSHISDPGARGVESRLWADGRSAGLHPPPPAGDRESLPAETSSGGSGLC